MLDLAKEILKNNSSRDNFFKLLEKYFPFGSRDYLLVEDAYDCAESSFRKIQRDNGDRYFEHLRCVALLVMGYMRVHDADVIAAALLHDSVEDTDWTPEKIALKFTARVSELVWWVTKPEVASYDGDKEARNRAYHQNLTRAPREAVIIKLADRLHNLLTLWETNKAKQKRKIRETQDFYLPIAEKHILLIHELEQALKEVMEHN